MSNEHLEVDHIVMGVSDLDLAAAEFDTEYGLTALPGGRHPGWGTANRIVPLGSSYLELVSVVDHETAATSAFGRWVTAMAAGETGWGWAVRTSDLSATARRLGLDTVPGSRLRDDGVRLTWELAGVPEDDSDHALPFFIGWGAGTPLPGSTPVTHRGGEMSLSALEVGGDPDSLATWLGSAIAGVEMVRGSAGVRAVTVTAPGAAPVTLRAH